MTVYLYDLIREGKIPCARQEMLVRAAYRGVSGGVSAPASVQKKARTFDEFNAFYKTQEWRKLRYEALKKYGPKCMLCGASKSSGAIMHVDHIKPRFRFPELELELSNLQILCEDCNMGKRDCSDWRLST
jgi:5-methylcytosine-specific restriction endonuclease McrA